MAYQAELATLAAAATTFQGLVAGLTASLAGPIPASLSQYATDSAALVTPLLEAAGALSDAVTALATGLDNRVSSLESRMTSLEARVAKLENPGG